jgi:hypothetical protein
MSLVISSRLAAPDGLSSRPPVDRCPGQAPSSRPNPPSSSTDRHAVPARALADIAAGLASTARLDSLPATAGGSRRYARLLETPRYDAWLIAWSPSSLLELHDHGGSIGAISVAMGELFETYTDLDRRHPLRSRMITANGAIAISATRVHEVWNPWPSEALSVHVYSPPLAAMTFFDDHPKRFLAPLRTKQGDLTVLEEAAT